jgi:cytoskeletal protein RodZ
MQNESSEIPAPAGKEKLGAYLQRARQAANMELNDVSRETKISIEFLKSMESGEYKVLPGDAYIRAYLRSLCKLYVIDSERILNWYLEETRQQKRMQELKDLSKLKHGEPTDENHEGSSKSSKKPVIIIAILAIAVLVVVSIIQKQGRYEETDALYHDSTADLNKFELDADSVFNDSLSDSLAIASQENVTKALSILRISCTKDSAWVQVIRRGRDTWARTIREKEFPKTIVHDDTLIVRLGAPRRTEVILNQKPIQNPKSEFRVFSGNVIE